jgi:hypothetical protein
MQASEALMIINNLIFRPGWKFMAGIQQKNEISIEVVIATVDTNNPPDYRIAKTISPPALFLDVTDLTDTDLMHRIKKWIEAINDHEDREFLRRGDIPGYLAPFHPHHLDSDFRWAISEEMAKLEGVSIGL